MAKYLDIVALQEPFDLGPDATGNRTQWSFNITVIKTESDTFVEEIAALLVAAGVGVLNSTLFLGSAAKIPSGDGPYTSILTTSGTSGLRTHNQSMPAYPRPAARIVVRAKNPVTARATCRAAYTALAGVRNTTVTP